MRKTLAVILVIATAFTITACDFGLSGQPGSGTELTNQDKWRSVPDLIEGMETIEQQVMFDQDGVKISAVALYMQQSGGCWLYILIENNAEYEVLLNLEDVCINSIRVRDSFSMVAEVKKRAQSVASFDLYANGLSFRELIPEVYDIEFRLNIRNLSADEAVITDVISLKTSAYGGVQEYDDSGRVLFDDGEIKIVERGLITGNKSGNVDVDIYAENLSSRAVYIDGYYVTINGHRLNSVFPGGSLPAGKRIYGSISVPSRRFDDIDEEISFIDDIEFDFRIRHYYGEGATDYLYTEKVLLTYGSIPRFADG